MAFSNYNNLLSLKRR